MTDDTPQVLIADDDDEIRLTLRLIMEEGGYIALEAETGEDALQVMRVSKRPLVVLLDVMMPRVDGLDVLRIVAAEEALRRHAYLLVTAGGKTLPLADAQLITRLGVRIIAKPFDLDALLDAVAAAAACLA
jgi:CheY-like chemotaxis protein